MYYFTRHINLRNTEVRRIGTVTSLSTDGELNRLIVHQASHFSPNMIILRTDHVDAYEMYT
jgi:hypothetical protein